MKLGVKKNLPASENLIRLLTKREELISINKAVDIYNILSIESKLCLGAHDIDKVDGNVTLKITEDPKNVLYLIIGNKEITDEELEKVTNNLISLTTKFASGKATIVK